MSILSVCVFEPNTLLKRTLSSQLACVWNFCFIRIFRGILSCSPRSWPQQHSKIVVVCGFIVALSETGSRPAGGISWRRVGNLAVRGPVGLKCLTSGPEFYSLTSFSEDCPPKRGYIWIFLTTKNGTNWQILLKRNFPALVPHWKVRYFLI